MFLADRTSATETTPAHPLRDTARRLTEFDRRTAFGFGAPDAAAPGCGRWLSVAELAEAGNVTAWLARMPADRQGMRNVATARLGAGVACAVVRPMMAALHLESRVPMLAPEKVWLARSGPEIVGTRIAPEKTLVLPQDPEVDDPRLMPAGGLDELLVRESASLATTFAPLVTALRGQGRFGTEKLWGCVLDMVGATSMLVARLAGLDQPEIWRRAARLNELLAAATEGGKVPRPTPFPVPAPRGDELFTTKGTCCLQFREYGARIRDDPSNAVAFCKTCPLLAPDTRQRNCAQAIAGDVPR
jgi:hypothetical protein